MPNEDTFLWARGALHDPSGEQLDENRYPPPPLSAHRSTSISPLPHFPQSSNYRIRHQILSFSLDQRFLAIDKKLDMSMERPVRKPGKVKKIITMMSCLENYVSSNKNSIKEMYEKVIEMAKQQNPEFVAESLDEEEIPDGYREGLTQKIDQEVQVSMEEFKENMETNAVLTPLQNEAVTNSYPDLNGSSTSFPRRPSNNRKKVTNSKGRIPFDPAVVIKVEGSDSDDTEEREKAEHLVQRMMASSSAPTNPKSLKSFLHYVIIENLPTRTTKEDVVNELFIELLGITKEEVTGITVLNNKVESVAQVYFKDLKHVQKLLTFSGKLVFNGRVITSKIGS